MYDDGMMTSMEITDKFKITRVALLELINKGMFKTAVYPYHTGYAGRPCYAVARWEIEEYFASGAPSKEVRDIQNLILDIEEHIHAEMRMLDDLREKVKAAVEAGAFKR